MKERSCIGREKKGFKKISDYLFTFQNLNSDEIVATLKPSNYYVMCERSLKFPIPENMEAQSMMLMLLIFLFLTEIPSTPNS